MAPYEFANVQRYLAEPARPQQPPGPSSDPAPPAMTHDPFAGVAPAPPEATGTAATPGRVPEDHEFVFNIVWTGVVFSALQYFVASQIAQSGSRFRFVVNGCPPHEIELMEAFRAAHPHRVVEVLVVSESDMIAHGVALDRVRAQRDDGPFFCLIDPDIKATAPFVAEFAALSVTNAAVTSGKEVWSDDNFVPEGNFGVAGEHFFDRDGFVYGSPHLAIYHRRALDATCERWGVGLGSAGPELRDDTKARLVELGRPYTVYDTAKIVNILLQGDGHRLVHHELPQLVHIGGLAHYISPPDGTGDGEQEPSWTLYPEMAARHEVSRYAARLLESLAGGREAPAVPAGLDPTMAERLAMVRREIVDLIDRYHHEPALATSDDAGSA